MRAHQPTLVPARMGAALFAVLLTASAVPCRAVPAPKPPPAATAVTKPRATPASTAPSRPTQPGLRVAQLTYPVPATASAADLLQAAEDYAAHQDWANYRQYLRQVVLSHQGSKEAGRALGQLLDDALSTGDQAQVEAVESELQNYPDPEVQAFAALLRTTAPALKTGQPAAAVQAYADYAEQWRGADTGGWAKLRLGDCYRYHLGDFASAVAVYQGLLAEQPGQAMAEEALLSLAQSLGWTGQVGEARRTFAQALGMVQSPGIQLRVLVGYSEVLASTGDDDTAWQAVTEVINSYPTHPCAGFAYAQRSIVEEKRGNWEAAVADVRAYFTYPPGGTYNQTRGHYVLARDAYRNGRLDEAAAEFAVVAQLAEADQHKTGTADFGGPAYAGLAAIARARGDLPEALRLTRRAAAAASLPRQRQVYLYEAADLTDQLGDAEGRSQIVAAMTAEEPGSHLTTKLVGRELLAPREP